MDNTTVSDALAALQTSFPHGYKPFIVSVRSSISRLLRRQGTPRDLQSYRVQSPLTQFGFVPTSVLPDIIAQKQLLELLGYHEKPGSPDEMCLDDFERRRPLLEQFIEFTAQVVCVTGSKGDPAGEKVLPDQVDLPSTVAYFSYHFHIRLELLDTHPPPEDILPSPRDAILSSIRAVESATRKIGIMKRGSDTYTEWEKLKENLLRRAGRGNETPIFQVQEEKLNMSGFVLSELSLIASKRLVDLWQYGQNVGSLLSLTYRGWSTSPDGAATCLDTSCNIGEDAFTNEYMSHLQTVRTFLVTCLEDFAPDELIQQAYQALKWQADHFLSSFQPHVFQEFDRDMAPQLDESDREEKDDSGESEKTRPEVERTTAEAQSQQNGNRSLQELINCLPRDTADKLRKYLLNNDFLNPELRETCQEMIIQASERQAVLMRELEQLRDSRRDCSLEAVRKALTEACDEKETVLQDTESTSEYLHKIIASLDKDQSKTKYQYLDNRLLQSWLTDVVLRSRGCQSELRSLFLAAGDLMETY